MRRRKFPEPLCEDNDRVAGALHRFFTYQSTLPPDEYVGDLLYLIKPGRFLGVGQRWARDCAHPDDAGAREIAALVEAVEATPPRDKDRIALMAYALAKTGGIARDAARPVSERLHALLIGHVRALQLTASVAQGDDAARIVRLTAALVREWPTAADASAGSAEREAISPMSAQKSMSAPPALSTGDTMLDGYFQALDAEGFAVEEPLALVISLLDSEEAELLPFRFRRRRLPPSLRLKALGYDEHSRHGFAAELSVDRWASRRGGTRLIRHPDSLFVVTDPAFDTALALAGQQAEASRQFSPRRSGQALRWSLRLDASAPDSVFFASGGSIAGAFAVAFRLVSHPVARMRLRFPCAVVCGLTETDALKNVDDTTIAAKLDAAGSEKIVLAKTQLLPSGLQDRYRRQIRRVTTGAGAARQCLYAAYQLILRRTLTGFAEAILLALIAQWNAPTVVRWAYNQQDREFDASAQFPVDGNLSPNSPWRYGWMSPRDTPHSEEFHALPKFETNNVNLLTGAQLFFWYPRNTAWPNVSYSRSSFDVSNPGAAVLWPGRALTMCPGYLGTRSCLRFVAPRAGNYRFAVHCWGASTGDFGATIFFAENERIFYSHALTAASTATHRGTAFSCEQTVHLGPGQTFDIIEDGLKYGKKEHPQRATGILCHVTRL